MAQTPVLFRSDGDAIDYTEASADKTAGDVVVTNCGIPGVVINDIDYSEQPVGANRIEGVFDFPQSAEIITIGQDVYWDADGSPYGGTASSGAATATAEGNEYLGICLATTTATTTYVRVKRIPIPKNHTPRIRTAIINANGGNIATAGQLIEGLNIVAGSDNSKGVQLPSCVDGAMCIVVNQVTDKTVQLYPPTGKQVNGAGANNAVAMAANTIDILVSEGTNAWYGITAGIDLS